MGFIKILIRSFAARIGCSILLCICLTVSIPAPSKTSGLIVRQAHCGVKHIQVIKGLVHAPRFISYHIAHFAIDFDKVLFLRDGMNPPTELSNVDQSVALNTLAGI